MKTCLKPQNIQGIPHVLLVFITLNYNDRSLFLYDGYIGGFLYLFWKQNDRKSKWNISFATCFKNYAHTSNNYPRYSRQSFCPENRTTFFDITNMKIYKGWPAVRLAIVPKIGISLSLLLLWSRRYGYACYWERLRKILNSGTTASIPASSSFKAMDDGRLKN